MIGIRCMETGRVWKEFDSVLKAVEQIHKYGQVMDCGQDRYTILSTDGHTTLMTLELVRIYETEPMSSFPLPVVVGVEI